MKFTFIAVALFSFQLVWAQEAKVAFTIKEKDLIPEGITYDPAERTFYVSSIQKRKIVKISSAGEISDFVSSRQDGMLQVLGMAVYDGKLWACNNTPEYDTSFRQANIHVYDLKSKKLFKQYKLNDGKKHLFNDLYITKGGDAFITDSEAGTVYRIKSNSDILEEFLPAGSFVYPNGLTSSADESKIFISTGSARGIVAVNLETKQVSDLTSNRFMVLGYDGLYRYGNSLIGVQNLLFPEAIHQMQLNNAWNEILRLKFLSGNDKRFDIPTTGVIVQDTFYFIANSQILQIAGNKGEIKNPESLTETIILKLKLN